MRTVGVIAMFSTSLLAASVGAGADVSTITLDSGNRRVVLIELFTSEGCSSCPPADRWLSGLEGEPGLWSEFVPIGFHVDYWDYIGWEDRFARREYSDRQRRYAQEGGSRSVYTPGMFADGKEWLGWRRGGPSASDSPSAGKLEIRVQGDEVSAAFDADEHDGAALVLHLALVGMSLETEVRAGENRGRTLEHDFVALGVTSTPLEWVDGTFEANASLPTSDFVVRDRALVAWVSTNGSQAPLQATGGFLPRY